MSGGISVAECAVWIPILYQTPPAKASVFGIFSVFFCQHHAIFTLKDYTHLNNMWESDRRRRPGGRLPFKKEYFLCLKIGNLTV